VGAEPKLVQRDEMEAPSSFVIFLRGGTNSPLQLSRLPASSRLLPQGAGSGALSVYASRGKPKWAGPNPSRKGERPASRKTGHYIKPPLTIGQKNRTRAKSKEDMVNEIKNHRWTDQ